MAEPVDFPQASTQFHPPPGFDESQIRRIPACVVNLGGNLDGARGVVVAWKPDAEDLARLNAGGLIYLLMVGGLAPHSITTLFPSDVV